MMDFKFFIRPAAEADFEAVASFPNNEEELYYMFPKARYPLTAEQLREVVESRQDATVVVAGGKPVAFADFIKVRKGKFCSIGNVIVDSSARRGGAGRFLVSEMERMAHEKYNAKEVSIACFNRNRSGVDFWTSMG